MDVALINNETKKFKRILRVDSSLWIRLGLITMSMNQNKMLRRGMNLILQDYLQTCKTNNSV